MIKNISKCDSPLGEYEIHLTKEELETLLKRDSAMDKILELRDHDSSLEPVEVIEKLTEITEELK